MLQHGADFVFTANHSGCLRNITLKMDRIEHAFCRAKSAADAFVLVYDAHAAAKAAGSFCFDLLFGESEPVVFKGSGLLRVMNNRLTGGLIKTVDTENKFFLVKFVEFTQVTASCKALPILNKTVK